MKGAKTALEIKATVNGSRPTSREFVYWWMKRVRGTLMITPQVKKNSISFASGL